MTLEEIARNWTPPDSLGYSSLRPVRLSKGGVMLAAGAAILAIGGVVLGVVLAGTSRRQAAERDLLHDQGILTDATVLRVWRSGGEENTPRVRYRFEVQGREFVASHRIPKTIWPTLKTGSVIRVRYLPADPSIHQPAASNRRVQPWAVAILVPAIFLIGAGSLAFLIGRQWRLLGEGRPAPGIVTGFKKSDEAVVMLYDFRMLNGAIKKGSGSAASSKSRPPVGSVVCVLYEPDNPRRHALYPLCLVRVEGARRIVRNATPRPPQLRINARRHTDKTL